MSTEFFLGSIVLLCIAAHFAWRNNNIVSRRNAAILFRSSFDTSYAISIYNGHSIDIFKTEFIRHQKAAVEFSNHLGCFSKRQFNKKWKEYEKWANKIFTESAHQQDGVYALQLAHEGRDIKKEFDQHLTNLLKYAKN